MGGIPNIPNITTNGSGIPLIQVNGTNPIQVNGTGVQFVQNIQSTNTTIRPIRKVQSDCALLAQCMTNPTLLTETYIGYVYDKIYRNDNMDQYIVYLPQFKLNTRVALKENLNNYSRINFKLFMFMEKANFKHKIRLQYISEAS